MSTEEELGYQDAIRQIIRSLNRRLKGLQEELPETDGDEKTEYRIRIKEIQHIIEIVESLHR